MPENTISHGIEGRLYEKFVRLAESEGMTPEQYAAKLGTERFFEKTRPKGSGKLRNLPVPKKHSLRDSRGTYEELTQ